MYLTLISGRHPDISKALKGCNAAPISGPYDHAVLSTDAVKLIERLGPPASSLTVRIPSDRVVLDKKNVLLITVPGRQPKDSVNIEGAFDVMVSGEEDTLERVLQDNAVRGYLSFELKDRERLECEGREVPLEGRNYEPAKKKRTFTEDDVRAYLHACQTLAERAETFCPTLVYAPIRGAHPIATGMLWYMTEPTPVFFPVTSSFVRDGRLNNKREIARLLGNDEGLGRVLYIEEIVSGGMLWGHYRELALALRERIAAGHTELKAMGIAHADGTKITGGVKHTFEQLQRDGGLHIEPISNLFTLDDNRKLGLHYTSYERGPHVVPFFDPEKRVLRNGYSKFKNEQALLR